MQHINTSKKRGFFQPLIESRSVQSAMMTLEPSQSSSEQPDNEHPRCEQWVFVIAGTGRAKADARTIRIKPGSLLLIEKDQKHQITNTGTELLTFINFYAPPAYTAEGDVKRSA